MQHGVTFAAATAPDAILLPAHLQPAALRPRPTPRHAADGYCRSRVAQFDAAGKWVRDFTVPKGQGPELLVPHRWVPWAGLPGRHLGRACGGSRSGGLPTYKHSWKEAELLSGPLTASIRSANATPAASLQRGGARVPAPPARRGAGARARARLQSGRHVRG